MSWITQPVVFNDAGLFINDSSIVEAWERPIQEQLAQSVCITPNLSILEIGYGLGLSAESVNTYNPKTHVVVEAHPDIAKRAGLELPSSATVICDYWENTIDFFKPGIFDGIIFDSYPFETGPYDGTAQSTLKFIEGFFKSGVRLLKAGGRLSFLDFSRSVHTLTEFNVSYKKFFKSYAIISVKLSIPKGCTYASDNSGNIIVLIK